MYSVTVCTCVHIGCAQWLHCCGLLSRRQPTNPVFRQCWPVFTRLLLNKEKSRACHCVQTEDVISQHFSSQTLLNKDRQCCKFLGEMLSSKFAQCVLWEIRLTKTKSICCAVHYTVTLPRAIWWTIRSPQSVWVLIATTTDAGCHRQAATVLWHQQPVPSMSSTTQLFQRICCSVLAASYIFSMTFLVLYYVTVLHYVKHCIEP